MSQEFISTLLPLILIGLIALVVGAIVGFLLAGLSTQVASPEPKRGKSLSELARIWRDQRSGKIALEIENRIVKSAAELSDGQREDLSRVADELQLWLGAGGLLVRAGAAPEAEALPNPSPPAPAVAQPVKPVPAATEPVAVEALIAPEMEVKPPSMDLTAILSRTFSPDKTKTARPMKSIASQVDEIVQERLPNSPFHNHLITLTEAPGGGLLVKVDNARYEGVGDVPDPEIRAFLRECVEEWESRAANSRFQL
jgi:hypothetical protein